VLDAGIAAMQQRRAALQSQFVAKMALAVDSTPDAHAGPEDEAAFAAEFLHKSDDITTGALVE